MDIFNPRQRMIAAALMEIAHEEGKFDWGVGANGAHYVPASGNPFLPQNIRCEECVFYADDGGCAIVAGEIEDNAVCKFWTIPEQEIIQVLPVSDVMDIVDKASGDTPIFMGASAMHAMGLIDDMKSADNVNLYMQGVDEPYTISTPDDIADAYHKRIVDQDGPEGFDDFKAELIAIAKRKGADYVAKLPKDWRDEMKVNLSTAERDALPDEDFAIPSSRNFPIDSPTAISDAVSGWGRYEGDVSFETFKQNLIRIALRKGQAYVDALPQAWQDEMQKDIVAMAKRYLAFLDS